MREERTFSFHLYQKSLSHPSRKQCIYIPQLMAMRDRWIMPCRIQFQIETNVVSSLELGAATQLHQQQRRRQRSCGVLMETPPQVFLHIHRSIFEHWNVSIVLTEAHCHQRQNTKTLESKRAEKDTTDGRWDLNPQPLTQYVNVPPIRLPPPPCWGSKSAVEPNCRGVILWVSIVFSFHLYQKSLSHPSRKPCIYIPQLMAMRDRWIMPCRIQFQIETNVVSSLELGAATQLHQQQRRRQRSCGVLM